MSFLISLFGFTTIASLYLSFTTLLGVRAGRYIVMFVIVLISIGPTVISKLKVNINIDFLYSLNRNILIVTMLALILLIYFTALKISINSYNKKDL